MSTIEGGARHSHLPGMVTIPRRLVLLPLAAMASPALAQPPPQAGGGGQGRGQGGGGGGGGPPQGRGNQGGQGGAGGGGPPQGRGNQGGQGGNRGQPGGPPGFGPGSSVTVQGWQAANPWWTPRPLPPGQMRQLARGRPLPPGIARQQVPPGLLAQLPVYPGHSYAMIGTSLVLLGSGGVVVDIMAALF